jgi:spore coat polysaccharide biosynthesis predicted glycosyltransferase SpsG
VRRLSRFSDGLDPWRLAVAVDVSSRVGFGHLKRCIAIGMHARSTGAQVDFWVAGDVASAGRMVEMAGFDCPKTASENPAATIVLVDRVHSDVLQHPEVLEVDIARWRRQGARIALIDGTRKGSLRHQRPHLLVDLFIAPYAGERLETASVRSLVGPAFAPLGAEYENAVPRKIRLEANRILVSCGGSDPFRITSRIMNALSEVRNPPLTVRVVLGPGFESAYRTSLVAKAHNSQHNIKCFDAPDSLASHMRWCDLAVTTSGLTKYELAATGTPAVLISPDQMHAAANEPFSALGTAADLGTAEHVTPTDIASIMCALLSDSKHRSAMARAGMRAVDGRGAGRIAKALKELAYVET